MGNLNKKQLQQVWGKLDRCLEALEVLKESGVDISEYFIDFAGIIALKNDVEILIESKTRK